MYIILAMISSQSSVIMFGLFRIKLLKSADGNKALRLLRRPFTLDGGVISSAGCLQEMDAKWLCITHYNHQLHISIYTTLRFCISNGLSFIKFLGKPNFARKK